MITVVGTFSLSKIWLNKSVIKSIPVIIFVSDDGEAEHLPLQVVAVNRGYVQDAAAVPVPNSCYRKEFLFWKI